HSKGVSGSKLELKVLIDSYFSPFSFALLSPYAWFPSLLFCCRLGHSFILSLSTLTFLLLASPRNSTCWATALSSWRTWGSTRRPIPQRTSCARSARGAGP